jgi:hypothetical protein
MIHHGNTETPEIARRKAPAVWESKPTPESKSKHHHRGHREILEDTENAKQRDDEDLA